MSFLFRNDATMSMSAMSFYKSIPGIIIDGDIEEEEETIVEEPVVEEPVVEESGWDLTKMKKKKWSPFFPEVKSKVEVQAVVEEPVVSAYEFEITLEKFKLEKATILRNFTNSLKHASTKEAIVAVLELQSSINIIADKFAIRAEKFKEVEPVEPVKAVVKKKVIKLKFKEAEPVEPVEAVMKKKVYKLKFKEGVTAAMVDEKFLEEFKGLEFEKPKKKVVKKKCEGASTSKMPAKYDEDNDKDSVEGTSSDKEDDGIRLEDC
jgi:hypothetical protein